MSNIGYMFYGYNPAFGNPHTTTGSIDPGFTNPIFLVSYSKKAVTGDLRFMIPDNTVIGKNVGCELDGTTKEIKGEKSYADSLSVDAKVSGGFGFFSFSASMDYQSVSEGTSSEHAVYVETKADCKVFEGHLKLYDPPLFEDEFLIGLKTLKGKPYAKNKFLWIKFLNYFGTHFVQSIEMGARYGYRMKLSESAYSSLQSQSIDVSASASVFGVSAGVDVKKASKNQAKMMSSSSEYKTFSIGSIPPRDNNGNTWANQAITEPMPISYSLREMTDIFTDRAMNLTQIINAKIDPREMATGFRLALSNYCQDYLLKNHYIRKCTRAKDIVHKPAKPAKIINIVDGSVILLRNKASGTCLTRMGIRVPMVMMKCNKKDLRQHFRFVKNAAVYIILDNWGYAVDITGAKSDNGIKIQSHPKNLTAAQKFKVIKAAGGYYIIQAASWAKCIDVANGSPKEHTAVQQWACTKNDKNQLFIGLPSK